MNDYNVNQNNQDFSSYGDTSRTVLTEEPNTQQVNSTPSRHTTGKSIVTILLSGLLGLGAGFGGASLALKQAEATAQTQQPTVVYQEVETIPSPTHVNTASTELSIQQIAQKAQSSVVEIKTEATTTTYGFWGGTYLSEAAGSGVILSEDGYIITNHHVIEGADSIQVTTSDGTTYDATLVGSDAKSDIGIIKINATGLNAATIGDSSEIQVGDTAVVIGNPLGTLGGTVTNGIISATDRTIKIHNEMMTLIQTNAAINSGNSGGGLFNGNGDLVGIVNAKDSGMTSSGTTIEGLGFAIPINDAMNVAEQLIENGVVTDRPYLGVVLQTITQASGDREIGVYITEVVPGSGAYEAGLAAGDRIIKADDVDISSYTDLSGYIKTKKIGDTIAITVVRDGIEQSFNVTLTGVITSTTNRG